MACKKQPARYVDSGNGTHLAVCSCGWRSYPYGHVIRAWKTLRLHELICHNGERVAFDGYRHAYSVYVYNQAQKIGTISK